MFDGSFSLLFVPSFKKKEKSIDLLFFSSGGLFKMEKCKCNLHGYVNDHCEVGIS